MLLLMLLDMFERVQLLLQTATHIIIVLIYYSGEEIFPIVADIIIQLNRLQLQQHNKYYVIECL